MTMVKLTCCRLFVRRCPSLTTWTIGTVGPLRVVNKDFAHTKQRKTTYDSRPGDIIAMLLFYGWQEAAVSS